MLEHLYHKPLLVPEEILETLKEYREMVKPFVCNTSLYLWNALKEGKTVLLEGQLGTLKDPDHGIYDGYLLFHTGSLWCNRCRTAAV